MCSDRAGGAVASPEGALPASAVAGGAEASGESSVPGPAAAPAGAGAVAALVIVASVGARECG